MNEEEVNKIIEVYDSVIADLKQALLDIKEYIEKYIKDSNSTYTTVEEATIIDIVNKVIGSVNNE